jgi:hypothetical protein
MLSPDPLASGVPHILGDAELLPNPFGLLDTAESKIPKHIIDEVESVENALSKHRRSDHGSIILGPEKT